MNLSQVRRPLRDANVIADASGGYSYRLHHRLISAQNLVNLVNQPSVQTESGRGVRAAVICPNAALPSCVFGAREIRFIERIEKLGAKFQVDAFFQPRVFLQRDVPRLKAGAARIRQGARDIAQRIRRSRKGKC